MAKKQYFITVDTETTMTGKVADFGAVISDRQGKIVAQCGVLVGGVYDDREHEPLFYDSSAGDLWSKASLDRRYKSYDLMLSQGNRMLASPAAINSWLAKAKDRYDPCLTAYNLPFDLGKCANTGIDLTMFSKSFCLWAAACNIYAQTKSYRQFVLDTHSFNVPTKKGNMTYKTNAEVMARFVLNQPELEDEPHTSVEDVIFYELPILNKLVARYSTKKLIEIAQTYNWRKFQVKDWFNV